MNDLPPISPADEIADLDRLFDSFGALRERLGERATERAPGVSAWCPAQHLYHVALSTDLAFRNVLALVREKGPMIVREGGPNELAVRVLALGTYPRGESQAPRMVQPGDDVDPGFLSDEMRRNRDGLEEVRGVTDRILTAPGRVPHLYLGELSAAEWLRFARLHARHHLGILEDVEAALA